MFHTLITQPITNLLFGLVSIIPGHDFGLAIIVLTAVIRLALWPLAAKQLHSQKKLSAIQPEVNRLKEKYKKDPQKFNAAVMDLYKEKEVSPFSSCLPLIIQLPFLIGIFYVFREFQNSSYADLTNQAGILKEIYEPIKNLGFVTDFLASTKQMSTTFLGVLDLAKPNVFFAGVAAVLQFVQTKMMTPKTQGDTKDTATAMTTQMTYIFPVLTFVIALSLPAALPLYWSITTLFAIGQQYLIMRVDVEKLEDKSGR